MRNGNHRTSNVETKPQTQTNAPEKTVETITESGLWDVTADWWVYLTQTAYPLGDTKEAEGRRTRPANGATLSRTEKAQLMEFTGDTLSLFSAGQTAPGNNLTHMTTEG